MLRLCACAIVAIAIFRCPSAHAQYPVIGSSGDGETLAVGRLLPVATDRLAQSLPPGGYSYPPPATMGSVTYGAPPSTSFSSFGGPPPASSIFDPYNGANGAACGMAPQNCFAVFGDFLYLKPRDAAVPYALPFDGFPYIVGVPAGPVGTVAPGYNPGFRVGGAVRVGEDGQIVATYTWYRSSADSTTTVTPPNVIMPLSIFPVTALGLGSQQATATSNINFQFGDLDYRAVLAGNSRQRLGYIIGGTYGRLVQDFSVTYPFAQPDGTKTVSTNSTFQGGGLVIGLEGERQLFRNSGCFLYGRGLARFISGQFKTTYTQSNQFGGIDANTALNVSRIVPVLDLELGGGWISAGGRLRLSAGYLVEAWYNVVTTPGLINSVQQLTFTLPNDTLTFDGLVARAEVQF